MVVPDVEKASERFEQLGVKFIKKPNDGNYLQIYIEFVEFICHLLHKIFVLSIK